MLRRWFRPAMVAGMMTISSVCHAQGGDSQDSQALFEQGLEDMQAGRLKIGCALIKRSLEIDPRPGTVFTLAECYSRAGKYASSAELYDRFLALYSKMPSEQQAQQQARAEISSTERNRLVTLVAWLTITLPRAAPAGLAVTRDGEAFPADLFGVALAVDPGPHVFTTRAPGGPLIEQRVDVSVGERKAVSLDVRTSETEPDPALPPPDVPDDETPEATQSGGLSPWVFVAGGIGAAGLVTGAVTGVILLGKRKTIFDHCDGANCDPVGLRAAESAQGTYAPITTVALGVGAAGALTTVVLLIALPRSEPSQEASISPALDLRAGAASLGVTGQF